MSAVVFLTMFLGLVSGIQRVELQVAEGVQSVRLELNGVEVTRLRGAPWVANLDLGSELAPAELRAVALDSNGHEIGKAIQYVNLGQPAAEVMISVNQRGERLEAGIVANHRLYKRPRQTKLSVDGAPLRLNDQLHAVLPVLDPAKPHVLNAEVRFEDGVVARRELVIAGGVSDAVETELSPVVIKVSSDTPDLTASKCFSIRGEPLRANAVETGDALVVLVKDPDANHEAERLHQMVAPEVRVGPTRSAGFASGAGDRWWEPTHHEPLFERGTTARIQWLLTEPFSAAGRPDVKSFPTSPDVDAARNGVYWLLTRGATSTGKRSGTLAYADAVAVAGVNALDGARRRAVVLLLGTSPESSTYDAAAVRRYLDRIGVPLFVWSFDVPRSELREAWGPIDEISTVPKLLAAVDRVKAALVQQRVVWLATNAATALRADVDASCRISRVAKDSPAPAVRGGDVVAKLLKKVRRGSTVEEVIATFGRRPDREETAGRTTHLEYKDERVAFDFVDGGLETITKMP